jgi:hypothetical protein
MVRHASALRNLLFDCADTIEQCRSIWITRHPKIRRIEAGSPFRIWLTVSEFADDLALSVKATPILRDLAQDGWRPI